MSAQLRHMATDKMGVALTRVSLFKDSYLSSINSPFSLRQPGMHWLELARSTIIHNRSNYNYMAMLLQHCTSKVHLYSIKHGCTISYNAFIPVLSSSPVFQSDLLFLNFTVLLQNVPLMHFRFHIDNTSRKGINVECNIYNLLLY